MVEAVSISACLLLRISVEKSATTRAESTSASSTYSSRQQETEAELSRLLGYTSSYYLKTKGDLGHREKFVLTADLTSLARVILRVRDTPPVHVPLCFVDFFLADGFSQAGQDGRAFFD